MVTPAPRNKLDPILRVACSVGFVILGSTTFQVDGEGGVPPSTDSSPRAIGPIPIDQPEHAVTAPRASTPTETEEAPTPVVAADHTPPTTQAPPPTVAAPPTSTPEEPSVTTTTPAPKPAPSAGPADPGTANPRARVEAALASAVPARWRAVVPVNLDLVGGSSSLSYTTGVLAFSTLHANGPWDRLRAIAAHEFGHHIAFRFGTGSTLGAPPQGWPVAGRIPVEHWSDCVARVLTGYPLESHGQGPCTGPSLEWTRHYLATGP